jgi:DNA replication protein DnaD
MSNQGWISIHRKLIDNHLWTEKRVFSKAEAWIDILLMVNHKEAKVVIKNTLITVERGQSILSLGSWSKRWNWNKSATRRFLSLLQQDEMIVIKNESITTRLTVCNYDSYQDSRNANETQTKRKRNANETQVTPNNNDNKENNDKKEKSFEFFWSTYPNKVAKTKCKDKFMKLKESDIDKIVNTIKAYIAYKPFEDYNHPNPLTYLNQERWNDEIKKESTTIHVSYPSN